MIPVDITSVQNGSTPSRGGNSESSPLQSASSSSFGSSNNTYPTITGSAGQLLSFGVFAGFGVVFPLVLVL
ncbi:hypothetical protein BKA82DRAFT_992880 [Pisolithus tinctorius]|uniref:Uncharacterized protein n=1 Tax=Pisolithus tinctorius Marx 270 TaxID=870435 RepID=A0A0C3PH42_PISTI|nr:hypothetical protein BKA82DRAFT_992880 [Pisolithus tinctorius]KIO13315.1 hypothetical protein M404DRAFT_992880 [Pisolithus tinctorius Marx 270]